ncbi:MULTISPECIES: fumarylacetoacetate hydrolase family protein [unclassified Microbacterium]|uniref:fumarylacetoacetate hydrolase family protein n=1 Tax=unclassified Microbacterium TaxID=2609290 RepID=UPI00301A453F
MHIQRRETPDGAQFVRREADGTLRAIAPPGAGIREMLAGTRTHEETILDPASRILPPLVPGKIVAIGLNYLDHIREAGVEPPTRPLIFAKFPSTVIADGDEIAFDPTVAKRVDWETELAVVIGSRARDVAEESALEHVFGYTIANDVSARDLQFADGQWIRGKNLDSFCPLGPGIVTADEIVDPQALALRTRVNGRLVQDSSTAEMLFPVAALISYCSHLFTLEPGDVLLTGTPWGCGEFASPPTHLDEGDAVVSEIEGIGTLTNRVRHRVQAVSGRSAA